MAQQVVPSSPSSSNPASGAASAQDGSADAEAGGKVDAVSVLYVIGGIPAILAFLVLLFAVGVGVCGLPA